MASTCRAMIAVTAAEPGGNEVPPTALDRPAPTAGLPTAERQPAAEGKPPEAEPPEGQPASAAEVLPAAGAYTAREEFLQKLEKEGQLSFKYVRNDGHPDNSVWCGSLSVMLTPIRTCRRPLQHLVVLRHMARAKPIQSR
jgi:hypothetical protein